MSTSLPPKSKQLHIFSNKELLLLKAQQEAEKAKENLQSSTKLYFITRYFVAVYESRNHEIPIQVWNEYRNALDHYFRWQTTSIQDDNSHLKKMERHLLRACLDVLKLFIHKTIQSYDEHRKLYSKDVYDLVDNGGFYSDLINRAKEITSKFESAKILDAGLGDDGSENFIIIDHYLDAAFAADSLLLELMERENDFINAAKTLNFIHASAHKLSRFEHFLLHAFISFLFGVGGWFFAPYLTDIKKYFEEITQPQLTQYESESHNSTLIHETPETKK